MSTGDDMLSAAAAAAGAQYGMTPEQTLTHIAMGDVPHPDARPGECGATDPRWDDRWCVLTPGHAEGHNHYGPPGFGTWAEWEAAGKPEFDAVHEVRRGLRP